MVAETERLLAVLVRIAEAIERQPLMWEERVREIVDEEFTRMLEIEAEQQEPVTVEALA